MKKMTGVARKVNTAGSALIGAIAISILMAIAGIGFLQVTSSGLNNDTAALEDLKALCAAESGANMGVRWLCSYTAFPSTTAGTVLTPFNNPIFDTVNNMDVYVTDSVYALNGMATAAIKAAAFKHPSGGSTNASTFKKRVP